MICIWDDIEMEKRQLVGRSIFSVVPRKVSEFYEESRWITSRILFKTLKMLLFCLLFRLLLPVLSFSPGQIRFGKVLARLTRAKTVSDPHFQDLRDIPTQKVQNSAHQFGETNNLRPVNDIFTLRNDFNIGDAVKKAGRSVFSDRLASTSLEHATRKIMHVKMDFHTRYTNPIVPQYNSFLSNLMAAVFTQASDPLYAYDALQAFGICTQYYTVMKGYACQDQVSIPYMYTLCYAEYKHKYFTVIHNTYR